MNMTDAELARDAARNATRLQYIQRAAEALVGDLADSEPPDGSLVARLPVEAYLVVLSPGSTLAQEVADYAYNFLLRDHPSAWHVSYSREGVKNFFLVRYLRLHQRVYRPANAA